MYTLSDQPSSPQADHPNKLIINTNLYKYTVVWVERSRGGRQQWLGIGYFRPHEPIRQAKTTEVTSIAHTPLV